MKFIEKINHGTLEIQFYEGWQKNTFDDNVLKVYVHFSDYSNFKRVEVSLDEKIVKVTGITSSNGYSYDTINLVIEDDVWNNRYFKDISVIKNLKRVGEKRLTKDERYRLEINFGRTKKGKEAVPEVFNILSQELKVLNRNDLIIYRDWDQTQELFITEGKTKLTIECSLGKVKDIVAIMNSHNFDTQADLIQEKSIELLIGEKQNIDIDLSPTFKK